MHLGLYGNQTDNHHFEFPHVDIICVTRKVINWTLATWLKSCEVWGTCARFVSLETPFGTNLKENHRRIAVSFRHLETTPMGRGCRAVGWQRKSPVGSVRDWASWYGKSECGSLSNARTALQGPLKALHGLTKVLSQLA